MLMMNATVHAVNELSWVETFRVCNGMGLPPSGGAFVRRYFVRVRPLIQNAPPAARSFLQECYPALGLNWPAEDAAAV